MGLFSSPSQKDLERQQKKELRGNERDLDKQLRTLALQEQKLQAEIKVLAKKNQEEAARMLAKQIVDIRQHKSKLMTMKGQISSVSHQSSQVKNQNVLAKSLASTTSAMKLSNQQLNLQQTQASMMAYEKESMKMEMGSEMMNETFDSEDASAEDALVNQVYDEIGLEFNESVKAVPTSTRTESKNKALDEEVDRFLAQYEQ